MARRCRGRSGAHGAVQRRPPAGGMTGAAGYRDPSDPTMRPRVTRLDVCAAVLRMRPEGVEPPAF